MEERADGRPTVSVIIPALNEALVLRRCLDALHACPQPPDEIVVVDNGSTDGTVALAASYPLVRVEIEPRKGVSYARTTGFDTARGDIIARIDADTIVHSSWAKAVRDAFASHPERDAAAGGASVAELSPGRLFWFSLWYRGFRWWHERSIGVTPMMYGFNGAMRRSAWQRARELAAMDDQCVSEDVDVTISLLRTGSRVEYEPRMRVKVRLFRSIDREKLSRYYRTDGLTLARHQYGNPRRWISEQESVA